MARRTLIRGCAVLSMDPRVGEFDRADILVEGSRISAIAREIPAADAEVVDAQACIALPGFVNAHIHAWQFQLRGLAADWHSSQYVTNVHQNLATRYTARDVHIGTRLSALHQIRGGTTTLVDWNHVVRDAEMADSGIDALESTGMRAVFVRATNKPAAGEGARPFYETPYPREEVERLRKGRLASDDQLVTLALGVLGPDWGTYEVAVADLLLAREFGLHSSAHAFGRPATRRVQDGYSRLAAEGLLDARCNIAHGNCFAEGELRHILDAGCSITATPMGEMFTGERPAMLGRLASLGGTPSIGSDVGTHLGGSMLGVARHAFMHQREYDNRSLDALGAWPPREGHATLVRDALHWATLGGAKAFGLDARTGSLTPGKEADLMLVDTQGLGVFPATCDGDAAAAALLYAEDADVRDVMVAGRFLKRGGQLVGPAALRSGELDAAAQSRQRLFRDAGFEQGPAQRGPWPARYL